MSHGTTQPAARSTCSFLSLGTHAQDEAIPNDEGPFLDGVAAYQSVGYKLDGIEGYIYPKTIAQPLGSVRLMRKYNPARDDHAIFPETALTTMTNQGYTQNSGSDWLGYVYPNTNGNVPAIN